MIRTKKSLTAAALLLSVSFISFARIDLSGKWDVTLDKEKISHEIMLPGTTDDAGLGERDTLPIALSKPQLLHLTRKNRYVGQASYSRRINVPKDMAGKPLRLTLGRVLWRSELLVDGKPVGGFQESLTTPHEFIIEDGLSEGEHTVTLNIDNSKQYDISVNNLAHAYTDDTQIMWNGVLGDMTLDVVPDVEVDALNIYPDVTDSGIDVVLQLRNRRDKRISDKLNWELSGDGLSIKGATPLKLNPGNATVSFRIDDQRLLSHLWSERHPELLTLRVEGRKSGVEEKVEFGMREITTSGKSIQINGEDIFLRGTLECCIYPLTGYPPMDEAGWESVFKAAKEWGLNHLRFHSWCPPEAAFKVADRMGFYLQVECPLWVTGLNEGETGADGEVKRFIREEFDRIVDSYGNHPSFCMMTMGNELQHDFSWLNDLVAHARDKDPRHLYASTSFTFEKGHGGHAEPQDQFLVTQWTDDGWVRGQGVFDVEAPSFNKNYNAQTAALTVPLVEHEIGQYAVYPDLSEIDSYTGVLDPKNFKAILADLEAKGRAHRAKDYLMASGKLAAVLYKEEIERALKTDGVSGIQLLGLQDFPGQGTALVGLVNAFWESKGIVRPEYFRQFCAPVVPLALFEKAVYTNNEDFEAEIEIANYSSTPLTISPQWRLSDGDEVVACGEFPEKEYAVGKNSCGKIRVPLASVKTAKKLNLEVGGGDGIGNSWSVWVYPQSQKQESAEVLVTADLKSAEEALKQGRKVLLSPSKESLTGMESHFVPVFWSPVHFPKQAGGMGIWCNPRHPALADFPTDDHTDWQWWHPLKNAVNINLEEVGDVAPIVEVVDNFTTNRNLGLIFEAEAGNGKLIFSAIDLLDAEDPVSRQLLTSLLGYMESDSFSPRAKIDMGKLSALIKSPSNKIY